MQVPSYTGKRFTVQDNLAIVRNPKNLDQSARFKSGERLPPNTSVGDKKLLPMMTDVEIRDARTHGNRNVYVYAVPVDAPDWVPEGWTRVTNLRGGMLNELTAFRPADWVLEPQGNNFTVTDDNALIRTSGPDYRSKGTRISVFSRVVVTGRSKDPKDKYYRVSKAKIEGGKAIASEAIGWTAASNLTHGFSDVFSTDEWRDTHGPNATWRSGRSLGARVLVDIIGTGGQLEQITVDSVQPYFRLRDAALKKNLHIGINSGFRTYASQKRLYDKYLAGTGNLAAKPGRSNHQHGQAFDLNTGGFDGSPIYDWMKKNGPKFGFIRTVNKEHWHWEYRPEDAAEARADGRFALKRVTR